MSAGQVMSHERSMNMHSNFSIPDFFRKRLCKALKNKWKR